MPEMTPEEAVKTLEAESELAQARAEIERLKAEITGLEEGSAWLRRERDDLRYLCGRLMQAMDDSIADRGRCYCGSVPNRCEQCEMQAVLAEARKKGVGDAD